MPYWPVAITTVAICATFSVSALLASVFPGRAFKFLAQSGLREKWPEWKPELEAALIRSQRDRVVYMLACLFLAWLGVWAASLEISRMLLILDSPPGVAERAAQETARLLGRGHWIRVVQQFTVLAGAFYLAVRPEKLVRWALRRKKQLSPFTDEESLNALKLVVGLRAIAIFLIFLELLGLRWGMVRLGIEVF